jgi:lysozyme family protein
MVETGSPAQQPSSLAVFIAAAAYVVDILEGGGRLIEDQGGLTRWGISKRAHPEVDPRTLTRDQALAIYRAQYWLPIRADRLPRPLALLLFDAAVNLGPAQAVVLLQRVLDVPDDGAMGPVTLAAAHSIPLAELLARYSEIRMRWYQELADTKPHHRPSLYGWRLRTFRVAIESGRWSRA